MAASLPNNNANQRIWLRLIIALTLLGGVLLLRWATATSNEPAPQASVAPVEQGSAVWITSLQTKLSRNPENPDMLAELGLAYLQRVRESGDSSLYLRAEDALQQSLDHDPQHPNALSGMGMLQLARHEFADALQWGEKANAANPYGPEGLGVMVDALVELGRYDEAIDSVQQMVDLRPGVASYSRVSYVREIHGNVTGAIDAMTQAVAAAPVGSEAWLWSQAQLGNLYLRNGKPDEARTVFDDSLTINPDYPYALAGRAKLAALDGNYDEAVRIYSSLTERLPLPEFVIALGELHLQLGNESLAAQQFSLVEGIQAINEEAGMNTDLEMALFNVDHGADATQALAQAQRAYDARPTVYAADILAWALYRVGDYEQAAQYSAEARRLGTPEAAFYYHAAQIADARGQSDEAATFRNEMAAVNRYYLPPDGE